MHKPRFALVYLFLAFVASAGVTVFAVGQLTAPVETTVTVAQPPPTKTAAATDMLAALGPPDQSVEGGQINQNLAGLTCEVYERPDSVTFLCHPPAA